jgi:hypothetical protein
LPLAPWRLTVRPLFDFNQGLADHSRGDNKSPPGDSQNSNLGAFMSAPSRRPEIRRRRVRKEKITQLRKRLAAAKTDADRSRLTAKLHKLSIASPGQPLVK